LPDHRRSIERMRVLSRVYRAEPALSAASLPTLSQRRAHTRGTYTHTLHRHRK